MGDKDLMTLDEAATLTGLSRRALEGRVERGTLAVEKRGGRVFVDRAELHRQRLVPARPEAAKDSVISELIDRLERQAETIAELRAELKKLRRGR